MQTSKLALLGDKTIDDQFENVLGRLVRVGRVFGDGLPYFAMLGFGDCAFG